MRVYCEGMLRGLQGSGVDEREDGAVFLSYLLMPIRIGGSGSMSLGDGNMTPISDEG